MMQTETYKKQTSEVTEVHFTHLWVSMILNIREKLCVWGGGVGDTTCKAQESCKETNLTFVFLTSVFISLSLIFSANSIFLSLYMKII